MRGFVGFRHCRSLDHVLLCHVRNSTIYGTYRSMIHFRNISYCVCENDTKNTELYCTDMIKVVAID